MKCNVGGIDRAERIFHGIVFLHIAMFLVSDVRQYVLGAYGTIRLLTGIFAFCPSYLLMHYSTRNKSK